MSVHASSARLHRHSGDWLPQNRSANAVRGDVCVRELERVQFPVGSEARPLDGLEEPIHRDGLSAPGSDVQ